MRRGNPTFNNKVDIWATGCVLYETLFRKRTFDSDFETLSQAFTWSTSEAGIELPETVDCIPDKRNWAVLSTMIHAMFEVKQEMRPSAKDLLDMVQPRGTPIGSLSPSSDFPVLNAEIGSAIQLSPITSETVSIPQTLENEATGTPPNDPNIISPTEIEDRLIFGLLTAARRNFKDKNYEIVEDCLKRACAQLKGSFRSHFQDWEELEEMLVISQCKMGNLREAEANVLKGLNESGGEVVPIMKLAKPLISAYCEKDMPDDAIKLLNQIMDFKRGKEVPLAEPQYALAEVFLRKKDMVEAKKLCEKVLTSKTSLSKELFGESLLLMCLICSENNDWIDFERYKEGLPDGYQGIILRFSFKLTKDFIKLDQLCLKESSDAMIAISNGHLDALIPTEVATSWRELSRRRSLDPSHSHQRLFLLQIVINFGKPAQVERLLKRWNYAEVLDLTWGEGENDNGGTVLMEASCRGRDDIVTLLCDYGANVDLASPRGWTALHCAVHENKSSVVRLLLEKKANIELKDVDDRTPLQLAKSRGATGIVKMLEEYIKKNEGRRQNRFARWRRKLSLEGRE